jgi:ubiquinone/menaquinone biosynthesis C-methylase UbiE
MKRTKIKKELTQEQVWDAIAEPWSNFRKNPPVEVQGFLKNKKGKILDLGCGSGRNLERKKGVDFYGVDFSEQQLKFAEKKAEQEKIKAIFFKSKCSNLPFKDNFFDSGIFIATLHCIENEEERKKAVQELYRVIKPQAKVMITVWDKESMNLFKENQKKEGLVDWKNGETTYKRYYYFYDEIELKKLLESIGFKINKIEKKETESRYSKKNIIFYCEK